MSAGHARRDPGAVLAGHVAQAGIDGPETVVGFGREIVERCPRFLAMGQRLASHLAVACAATAFLSAAAAAVAAASALPSARSAVV